MFTAECKSEYMGVHHTILSTLLYVGKFSYYNTGGKSEGDTFTVVSLLFFCTILTFTRLRPPIRLLLP